MNLPPVTPTRGASPDVLSAATRGCCSPERARRCYGSGDPRSVGLAASASILFTMDIGLHNRSRFKGKFSLKLRSSFF